MPSYEMETADPDAPSKRPRGDVGSLLNNIVTAQTAHPSQPPSQPPSQSPHTIPHHRPALPPPHPSQPRIYSSAPSPPVQYPATHSAPPQGAYVPPPAAPYNHRAQSEQRPSPQGPVPIHNRPGHGSPVTYQQGSGPPPLEVKPLSAPQPVQGPQLTPQEYHRRPMVMPAANGDGHHHHPQQHHHQPPPPQQVQHPQHPQTPIAQPPPSMDHGHHQGYPPQEQQQPQQQQPPPPPPQQQQHQQHQHHPNEAPHSSYGMPPPEYGGHPMALAPSYAGQPHMYGPQMPYSLSYGGPLARKKQVRATQACNNCRQRKQKCDEQRPCAFCKENQTECTYKDIPPPKTDRTMAEVLSRIAEMQEAIIRMEKRFSELNMGKSPPKLEPRESATPSIPPVARSEMGDLATSYSISDNKTSPDSGSSILSPSSRDVPQTPFATPHIPPVIPQSMDVERKRPRDVYHVRHDYYAEWNMSAGDLLPDLPQGKETLPERHSTQAHRLLQEWPSMRPFFDKNYSPKDYPAELEMERGTLQLYGRGEGMGVAEAEFHEYLVAESPSSSSHSDEIPSHISSPPQDVQSAGKVALDAQTCERLLQSYLNVMYPMQPFLVKHRIKRLVDKFVKRVNRPYSSRSPHPGQAVKKRRTDDGFEVAAPPEQRAPDKTITSAIVLLVLALGEICQYTEPLPAPYKDPKNVTSDPGGRYYKESPTPSSTVSSPLQHDIRYGQYRSPGGGERSMNELKRNLDIYPGLRYFTMAVEILGGVIAGTDILHVQGFLLAALYEGQLGRVNESWTWIWNAGRVSRLLVRKHQSQLRFAQSEPSNDPIENVKELIKWAYWATVQLESDILAEMESFFPTRVTIEESVVAYPMGVYVDPENIIPCYVDSPITDLYSAQIMLRRLLNKAHAQLYGITGAAEDEDTAYEPRPARRIYKLLNELRGIRKMMNDHFVKEMRWSDDDSQTTDLNVARMRAKYYGAEYIISRPFLHYAIHCQPREKPMIEEAWRFIETLAPNAYDVFTRPPIPPNIDERALRTVFACQKCINAAFNSTYAFDKIKGRLMITNIFGTMHAQFGNCLVLAAAYLAGEKQPWLRMLAPKDSVVAVLSRTIDKIGQYAPISPALEVDVAILKRARQAVNGEPVTVPIPLTPDNSHETLAASMNHHYGTAQSSFSSAC